MSLKEHLKKIRTAQVPKCRIDVHLVNEGLFTGRIYDVVVIEVDDDNVVIRDYGTSNTSYQKTIPLRNISYIEQHKNF